MEIETGKDELLNLNHKPYVITKVMSTATDWFNVVVQRKARYASAYPDYMGYAKNSLYIPETDFISENGNRIWACKFGKIDTGEIVNEIRCSELGNFLYWNRFEGTNNDSWVSSVGSDGPFTGICTYDGSVLVFKENCIHKVSGTLPSTYSITTQIAVGLK